MAAGTAAGLLIALAAFFLGLISSSSDVEEEEEVVDVTPSLDEEAVSAERHGELAFQYSVRAGLYHLRRFGIVLPCSLQ